MSQSDIFWGVYIYIYMTRTNHGYNIIVCQLALARCQITWENIWSTRVTNGAKYPMILGGFTRNSC